MAQFGSAAKDPSMDEILASIRKIIEEGDGAAVKKSVDVFDTNPIGPAANDVTRAYAAPEPRVTEPRVYDTRNDDYRLHARPAYEADLRSSTDMRQTELRPTMSRDTDHEVESALDAATFRALEAAAAASANDIDFEDFDLDMNDDTSEPTPAPVRQGPAATSTATPVGTSAGTNVDFARPQLMSSNASRHVASSFSELADALAANRQRSLDEIAEEVLRPMLQDWLDNNLPTMVERMVREEIERVARGG